ncbi:MAG: hypothetical protein IJV15_02285 [Lachnospiraceae bacterium]|nr:hypothetical protein [Lachnospiraceae bacterium]
MSTVIYLANQQVQIVTGSSNGKKMTINQSYILDAPEGSIINGIVMDAESFIGFLKETWSAYRLPSKDVTLVVNSSKFVGKNIEMPALNDSKTLDFIEREFTDINKGEEYVYGYIPLSVENKIKRIYAENIPSDFIKDYLDIFAEAGIKIKALYSGESSIINFVANTVGRNYSTFILELADRMTITTLLFVNGTFYYFNSTRCFHEQESEEYAQDMARSASQIIQFMQAHQIEYPLETVILAGVNPNNIYTYSEAILSQGIQVAVRVFDDNNISSNVDIQNCIHASSGLVNTGKHQNFLTLYSTSKKKTKEEGGSKKGIIAIVASIAIMLIALASCLTLRVLKNRELKDAQEANQLMELSVLEYDMILSRNTFISQQYRSIVGLDENIQTYPICNTEIMNIIKKCAGNYADIKFNSFDSNSGIVTVSAKSESVEDINMFIKELNNQDIFSNVDYTGYNYLQNDDNWNINVSCTLSESAGRKGEIK